MEISQDLFERLVDIRRTSNRFMVTSGIEITDAPRAWCKAAFS